MPSMTAFFASLFNAVDVPMISSLQLSLLESTVQTGGSPLQSRASVYRDGVVRTAPGGSPAIAAVACLLAVLSSCFCMES